MSQIKQAAAVEPNLKTEALHDHNPKTTRVLELLFFHSNKNYCNINDNSTNILDKENSHWGFEIKSFYTVVNVQKS